MADTEVKKGFLNGVHAALHWLLHIVLLPEVWVLDALGKGISWLGVWLTKVGADVAKIGADLDAL